MRGDHGHVGITIPNRNLVVSSVTIEQPHINHTINYRTAPRNMSIWGLVHFDDDLAALQSYRENLASRREADALTMEKECDVLDHPRVPESHRLVCLRAFTYDRHSKQHIQNFEVAKHIQHLQVSFRTVLFVIGSNWGEKDLTCIYPLRVHGKLSERCPATPTLTSDI